MKFIFNDGGRAASGRKGRAGDCVARSIAIVAQLDYETVYNDLAHIMLRMPKTKRRNKNAGKQSADNGVYTKSKLFKDYMASLGFVWTPTMKIGTGCKVHLHDGELPAGRLIVAVSKHYTAVIDGVIHDIGDPQREYYENIPDDGSELGPLESRNINGRWITRRRCVYGYWKQA